MRTAQMLINGRRVPSGDGRTLDSINPFSGDPWATIPAATQADVDEAVRSAHVAFDESWWRNDPRRRATALSKLADLFEQNLEHLAATESSDNGKPIRECRAVMASTPSYLRYQASLAMTMGIGEMFQGGNPEVVSYNVLEPYGVIAIQVPWNTPVQLLVKSLAPVLAAGNAAVVKPSEYASVSVLEFAELVTEAGIPDGIVNVVTGLGPVVGAALCGHHDVKRIVLTGGPEAGRLVAHAAADRLVPATLELGGKSPNIVFDDANIVDAVAGVAAGFTGGAGQSCVCGSRALIHEAIYNDVMERLVKTLDDLVIGDPSNDLTQMGPLCTPQQHRHVSSMVSNAVDAGAVIAYGPPPGAGDPRGPLFFSPTVFTNVTAEMEIVREEVFGPVLCVMPFKDESEAIAKANDTRFGLAAGVWTENLNRAHRVARSLRAGMVWVNDYRSGDAGFPFGGYGESGYGRANGRVSYEEMSLVKSVQVRYRN